jgi:ethanolamine ammonia-lyase large subunit
VLYLRQSLGLRPAPEFEDWLLSMGIFDAVGKLPRADPRHPLLALVEG